MATQLKKFKKNKTLRNNEYYNFQDVQDNLFRESKNGKKFKNLMELITDDRNILLAYRNIKRNKGSNTVGTNFKNILDIAETEPKFLIQYVKDRLIDYKPEPVRRVEIPRPDGRKRPLGIPCIEDRLIQQCIKQILEPICEAKFHLHNYGFRPNRSTHHAIGRMAFLANRSHLHYVVDIDIKGFFDNVNHSKLLKQMWTLGIQDKSLICVISKMLKAEVKGIGIPTKGTPQGGILSPLLSNIVLNELDWWISSQWETFKTKHDYHNHKYRALKISNLKEIFIVRYADDFKLMCRDYETAQKAFIATKNWLKERLDLEISPEKSKVINLKKKSSDFLGFKLKIIKKAKKRVINSNINDKATKKIIKKILGVIRDIKKSPTCANVNKYNATILGMHNYYRYATHVNMDFSKIAFLVSKNLYNSTKILRNKIGKKSKAYMKYYGKYNFKILYISEIALFPINGIKMKNIMNFSQDICNFTEIGRMLIHKNLKNINQNILKYLMKNPKQSETTEYNDNRISLYVGQQGKCSITGEPLQINSMEFHHKIPRELGGKNEYSNFTFISYDVHKLIHAKTMGIIQKYMTKLEKFINEKSMIKINKLRKLVGNCELYID